LMMGLNCVDVASRVSPRRAPHFSLLRQRKVSKRKASRIRRPALCAGTLRCSGRAGCAETRPAGSNICAPFSAHPCATRLLITARNNSHSVIASEAKQSTASSQFHCAEVGVLPHAVEAGLSSTAVSGSRAGACLSEASSRQTPLAASSARNRAAALTSARLLFAYFLLAKQEKVSRPPGRDPACRSGKTKEDQ
jgi:hypothetical protein